MLPVFESPAITFGLAAVCAYVAARIASPAPGQDRLKLGPIAIAHWLPIATLAVLAARAHRNLAISVIFGSSVATMFLAMGVTLLCSPPVAFGVNEWSHSEHRRIWGMVLPTALLMLLCGFSGHLTLLHAGLLAAQGAICLATWWSVKQPASTSPERSENTARFERRLGRSTIGLGLAMTFAVLTLYAVGSITSEFQRLSDGLIGAAMISPSLALPMLGTGLAISRDHGRGDAIVSLCVAIVLLNLTLLVPLVILISHFVDAFATLGSGSEALKRPGWLFASSPPVPFPIANWRIDTVALLLAGALLIPVANGRWPLRRSDGGLLLAGFCLYLVWSVITVTSIAMH